MVRLVDRRRGGLSFFVTGLLVTVMAGAAVPASAVNSSQSSVVSTNAADFTPHVMNGSVQGITQIGNTIVAVGTFTTVRQTLTGADITRNRVFAFNATTGVIDPTFNPNLGGSANSVDNDGTNVYVGGSFGSVGGNTAIKRVVKLTAAGAVVSAFNAVPNSGVNEVVVRGTRLYVGGSFTNVRSGTLTTPRNALAALDSTSGAVVAAVNVPFTGVYDPAIGGTTNIKRFDVTSDGSRLVAIGNFSTVGTQPRSQIAVLDTTGTAGTAGVASWATNRYDAAHNNCASVFDTFVRDVDFSPDGSYFAVTSTGAYAGGAGSGTLCDTTTRWETNSTGNDPTWADYTGGDTTYGVAVTGAAIYTGGHMRWQNNPYQGDQAGPGAVAREGIAALDPVNGLPLSWNPGRTRGVGAQALYATSTGLWVGSDTDKIGQPRETHSRIAFLPLAGGTTIPQVNAALLPNDLFLAEQTSPGRLLRRPVDASGAPTGAATVANSAIDWSLIRGAFLLNGTIYYGLTDGGLYARTFNKTTGVLGAQTTINLYDDPDNGQRIPFAIANLTGMFYDTASHRIYYTLANDSQLYYRYFTPESRVVGAQTFVANNGGVNLRTLNGVTLASGRVLYGSSADGALRSIAFGPGGLTGSPTVVSNDGTWRARALLVPDS